MANESITIIVNNKECKASKTPMSGKDIKELAGQPAYYKLFEAIHDHGKEETPIGDDQLFDLNRGCISEL